MSVNVVVAFAVNGLRRRGTVRWPIFHTINGLVNSVQSGLVEDPISSLCASLMCWYGVSSLANFVLILLAVLDFCRVCEDCGS